MTYKVGFHTSAEKEFDKLAAKERTRISKAVWALADNPRPPKAEKMAIFDAYRLRVGDYRVVYSIEDDLLIVLVVKVGHRREVYREADIIRKRLSK